MSPLNKNGWTWKLPEDPTDIVIVCYRSIVWLMNSKYALLIRKHGYQFAGIVKKETKDHYNSELGRPILYVEGFTIDQQNALKNFREPWIRISPITGRDEQVILYENPLMILTARNSPDWASDDENFTWEVSAEESKQVVALNSKLVAQQDVIQNLQEELQVSRQKFEEMKRRAEQETHRAEQNKDKNLDLIRDNLELRGKVSDQEEKIRYLESKDQQGGQSLAMMAANVLSAETAKEKTQREHYQQLLKDLGELVKIIDSLRLAPEDKAPLNGTGVSLSENASSKTKKTGYTPKNTPNTTDQQKAGSTPNKLCHEYQALLAIEMNWHSGILDYTANDILDLFQNQFGYSTASMILIRLYRWGFLIRKKETKKKHRGNRRYLYNLNEKGLKKCIQLRKRNLQF